MSKCAGPRVVQQADREGSYPRKPPQPLAHPYPSGHMTWVCSSWLLPDT